MTLEHNTVKSMDSIPGEKVEYGTASVHIVPFENGVWAHNLIGGDPSDLKGLGETIAALPYDVYFPIAEGDIYEKLKRMATRLGAQKYNEVWVFKNGK